MSATKQDDKGDKDTIVSSELTKAKIQMLTSEYRPKVEKMKGVVDAEEMEVSWLQHVRDRENSNLDEFTTAIERIPLDAQNNFDKAAKSKQENNAVIDRLNKKTPTFKGEFVKVEELLNRHTWCGITLFKQSSLEWQEAQKAKALKAKNAQNEQNSEPDEAAASKGE